jgi:DNA polymerase III epsilon subunit-like protein
VTAHHLERQRLQDGHLGHHCSTCGQTWARQPQSACPGVPLYSSWDRALADGLRTQTQWRAERRRLLADVVPLGAFPSQKRWYWLYGEAQTTPMREASPAQRAVLERGRLTQRTCTRCGRGYGSAAALDRGRVCYVCLDEEVAREEAERDAEARASAIAWAKAFLEAADFVVLDTETTSLEEPEILEIALLSASGEILLDTLVRPISPIDEAARAVHGITDEDLASAPRWPAVYPRLVELLSGQRVLAYNAAFDADAIVTTCRLHGLAAIATRWFDLLEPYAEWFGEWSDTHDDYRFQPLPGGGHRAADDCRAALHLLQMMSQTAQTMAVPQ